VSRHQTDNRILLKFNYDVKCFIQISSWAVELRLHVGMGGYGATARRVYSVVLLLAAACIALRRLIECEILNILATKYIVEAIIN